MANTQTSQPKRTQGTAADNLDRHLISGVLWTGIAKWGTQALSWASTIIVARLLTPADFGIVSLATVYLGLLSLVSEFGVGTAIVSLRDLDEDQVAQLNSFAVALGIVGFLFSCVAARPMGRYFNVPQLPIALVVMSLGFVVSAFQSVPMALLQRDLQFKTLSVIDGIRAVVLAAATVGFALAGLGYWTLIYGSLLSTALGTGLIVFRSPHRFARPNLESLRHAMVFSWRVLVARLAWYSYSNADFVVAGKTLGQTALGSYTLAWNIATMPVEKITSLIGGVTPAFFSTIQNDRAELRKYLLNITEGVALLTFPAAFGLALIAKPFVITLLGPKWSSVVVPLQLLTVYVSVRSISPILPHVLNVTGGTRFGMWSALLNVVLFPPAFYIGSRWGASGIATAWIAIYPISIVPLYWRVFRDIQLRLSQYLKVLIPALTSSLVMALGVFITSRTLPASLPGVVILVLLVVVGIVLYVASILLFFRDRASAIYRRLRPRPA